MNVQVRHKRPFSPWFHQNCRQLAVLLNGDNLLDRRQLEGLSTFDCQTGLSKEKDVEFDFTRQSAALQPDKIVDSACQFCNSLCRLKVHMKSGRIIDILGEPDDPVQAGNFLYKGADDDATGL